MYRRYVNSKIAQPAGYPWQRSPRVLNNSDTVKAEKTASAFCRRDPGGEAISPIRWRVRLRTARSYMILVMVSNIANRSAPKW